MARHDVHTEWPDAVEVLNERGSSPYVLVCEHASNYIPAEYGGLGLSEDDRQRHIAWDIGAAAVTRSLSAMLDAPAFLGTYSRLLIDLNRPVHAPTSVPVESEATDIPGNRDLSDAERLRRVRTMFSPFHARIAAHLDERQIQGRPTELVSIHSFTPIYLNQARPWHAGVLYEHAAKLGRKILERLAEDTSLNVAANLPYKIDSVSDYCVPIHGEARGLPAILIEIRNDLLHTPTDIERWAARLGEALTR